ncbi:efflux RND transporter periplasmic adaptor subunit [Moraxella nasibovis]|uniref:efflux RND transporter periplasmic adaptor subunit n=1 Tax=Moraxella nasibovis TaxID=2904120 RepID=UPI0024102C7F|nr:efflux RND transporter periplasmic adaptor subunit [Moraxella nasibovis]WFF39199.1 efflux RND transporter periplasmic adaptor subunit [Moraxella nasibovis]
MKTTNNHAKSRSYKKWAILLALLAMVGLLIYQFAKPKPTAPTYLTAPAVMGDIESTVMASAKVKPIKSVDVGAQVSGRIVKLYVEVGDEVKQGDIIAQISQVEQKNTVANAQANLNQANASLAQAHSALRSSRGSIGSSQAALDARISELNKAKKAYERLASLISIDAVSRQDYDDAKAAVEVAEANVAAARANLQNANNEVLSAQAAIKSQEAAIAKAQNDLSTATEDLSYTTITAPMDGTVVSITQKEGTTVNANQSAPTIVTLADLSRVRINAQISEADVIKVSTGMPARFNIIGSPEAQFDAVLTGVEPAPEVISSTSSTDSAVYYIGYLDVDNADRRFRIDMTAQVNIIVNAAKNVLTIPSAALQNDGGKYSVRVLDADGNAKPIPVEVGLDNRVTAEIKSGLNAGDQVIIGEDGGQEQGGQGRSRPPMMR